MGLRSSPDFILKENNFSGDFSTTLQVKKPEANQCTLSQTNAHFYESRIPETQRALTICLECCSLKDMETARREKVQILESPQGCVLWAQEASTGMFWGALFGSKAWKDNLNVF